MNELEVRMRVHALAKDMIYDFMAKNGIGATVMVDALNSVLVGLYPLAQGEMLRAIDMETAAKAQQQVQEINQAEQKATPKEKEVK
jgi:hypothetical protein|nr:MAG TPA: Putative prokaryotic signal transducing protein [Caudoviricetes sp.]